MDSINNHTCSICLGLFYNPINTKCNHTFCKHCLLELVDYQYEVSCPLCRKAILNVNTLKIDEQRDKLLKSTFPSEYSKRQTEVQQQILLQNQILKLTLQYGNTHETVPNPNPSNSSKNNNQHKWNCFLKLVPSEGIQQDYISKVEFTLHETFAVPLVKCQKAPYQVGRVGWGTFQIPIKVYWQNWLGIPQPTEFTWTLQFNQPIEQQIYTIKLNKSTLKPKPKVQSVN